MKKEKTIEEYAREFADKKHITGYSTRMDGQISAFMSGFIAVKNHPELLAKLFIEFGNYIDYANEEMFNNWIEQRNKKQ